MIGSLGDFRESIGRILYGKCPITGDDHYFHLGTVKIVYTERGGSLRISGNVLRTYDNTPLAEEILRLVSMTDDERLKKGIRIIPNEGKVLPLQEIIENIRIARGLERIER